VSFTRRFSPFFALGLLAFSLSAGAQEQAAPYQPIAGQPGKDVVWVPTPDVLIEKMLDMAEVTPKDFVIDLGSGDGRAVIAAARRGAEALGVEFNGKLVGLARERAREAGVEDKARFIEGDMYEADLSRASVLVLFLLEENLDRLAPKFLAMKPGSRIALNTYLVPGWTADRTVQIGKCDTWCTAHLYIVPAKAGGTWQLGAGTLTLRQIFKTLRGTLTLNGKELEISEGRLRGREISFLTGGARYEGRVEGDVISGNRDGKPFTARRVRPD
jgi:SAM-dependent methyltransferase